MNAQIINSNKKTRVGFFGTTTPAILFNFETGIDLFGHQNITDFDFAIMSLSALYTDYARFLSMEGIFGYAAQRTHEHQLPHIVERLNKVRSLVDAGTPLIILMDHCVVDYVKLTGAEGRVINHTPYEFARLMLPETLPHQGIGFDFSLKISGFDGLLFQNFSVKYQWELASPNHQHFFKSLSKLEMDRKSVGSFFKDGDTGGIIAFAPPPTLTDASAARNYLFELMRLCGHIQSESKAPRPAWVEDIWLPRESEIVRRSRHKLAQAEAKRRSAKRLQKLIEPYEWHKDLIVGTDKPLERAVLLALNSLGIRAVEGPPGRADLIAIYENYLLVGEVKGYEGAAKEACVGQCRKWLAELEAVFLHERSEWDPISEHYADQVESLGISIEQARQLTLKGLVVLNTYRSTSIGDRPSMRERTGENISGAMQGLLNKSEISGMLSMQLLGLLQSARESEERTSDFLRHILNHSGVFVELDDRSFIGRTRQ